LRIFIRSPNLLDLALQ